MVKVTVNPKRTVHHREVVTKGQPGELKKYQAGDPLTLDDNEAARLQELGFVTVQAPAPAAGKLPE